MLTSSLYQERFPRASRQMEDRLRAFVRDNEAELEPGAAGGSLDHDNIAIVRFVHHQLLEVARDCLAKSQERMLTSRYFYEMSENLEQLLLQVNKYLCTSKKYC